MRTKTLLLSAAALVAGVIASEAQSNVYSANVIGYVNTVFKGGGKYTLVSNPLDDGNGNQLTNVVAALPNKSSIQVWDSTHASFVSSSKILGNWSTNFAIPPGTGFFVLNSGVNDITNTFSGSVAVVNAATNTTTLPAGTYVLAGTAIPYTGVLTDPYNQASLNLGATLPNKSSVQVWDSTAQGFVSSSKILGNWSANLALVPGQGYFILSGGTTNWIQTLQLQ